MAIGQDLNKRVGREGEVRWNELKIGRRSSMRAGEKISSNH